MMLTTWIKSPIPYAGCKFDMLDELEAIIGSGETLVDMFTGSGVVGANMAPRFERVLCIDILADLIAMHDNFKRDDPDAIIEKMRGGGLSSREPEKYRELRDAYNARAVGSARASQDPAELGYRFYGLLLSCTNNLARFNLSGGFNQTCGKRELSETKSEEIRRWCLHLQEFTDRITYMARPCWKLARPDGALRRLAPGTTIYVDPPYSNTQAGYNAAWGMADDDRLASLILGNVQAYKAAKKTRNQDTRELVMWNG